MFTVVSLRDNPGMSFFELFFATRDSNGHLRGAAIVWAWAPVVLLPLGALFAWIAVRRGARQASN
ncbi:hypothetical protein FHX76_000443 [Lysinibacter cavernae]|uniref:Uncharacterized protein n=1 Tax=Lysinibacter cavernae TaxID=1640652 RepID=A0A7X5QYY1_9MICO|nr:hypothetical protein [Lysinibacter cavernae]